MYMAAGSAFVRNSLVLGYIRAPSVSGPARWRHVDPMWASNTTVCYRRWSLDNKRPAVWLRLRSMCGGVLKAWRESAGFWSRRLALKPWKLQNHRGDRHAEPQRGETISAAPRKVFCWYLHRSEENTVLITVWQPGQDGSTAFHKDDSRSHEMFSFPSWRWQIWRQLKKHGWDRPAENMYDSCVEIKTKRRPLNEWRMSACTVTKGKLRYSLSFWCRRT